MKTIIIHLNKLPARSNLRKLYVRVAAALGEHIFDVRKLNFYNFL